MWAKLPNNALMVGSARSALLDFTLDAICCNGGCADLLGRS